MVLDLATQRLINQYALLEELIQNAIKACQDNDAPQATLFGAVILAETKRLDRMLDGYFGQEET